jgi:NTP pyrophosphatase (non-canonical NTP hydrolase)
LKRLKDGTMDKYRILQSQVIDWAKEKGILENGTPIKQSFKTLEEVGELINAISTNNHLEIKDALGDILVTLIIQAKMQNVDLIECLNMAYNTISKRNGQMVNGTFVKDL